jgi:hypothetical protein
VIKVDIEGGEYDFIRGAQKSIEKFRPVMILELNDALLRRNNSSRSRVVIFLKKLGFRCYQIENSNDVLVSHKDKSNIAREVAETWLREMPLD